MTRTEVAAIRKADGAEVRVTVQGYKGRRVVDVRVWYQPAGGAEFVPTRKGVTVDADKLPALAEAIEKAMAIAGVSGEGHATGRTGPRPSNVRNAP
jgi:hypothetical protein